MLHLVTHWKSKVQMSNEMFKMFNEYFSGVPYFTPISRLQSPIFHYDQSADGDQALLNLLSV